LGGQEMGVFPGLDDARPGDEKKTALGERADEIHDVLLTIG
jgi:hypothetical protein